MTKGQIMQYDIRIDGAELIAILAALGKEKAKYENLRLFEEAHQISDILVKFQSAKPLHAAV